MVLYCNIMTLIPGRKYDRLLSKKGGRGFPYLVYMDSEGNVIGHPAGRSVKAFEAGAKKAQHYLDLKNKAKRTPDEEVELANLSNMTSEDGDTYRHQPLTRSQDVRRLREREGGTVR